MRDSLVNQNYSTVKILHILQTVYMKPLMFRNPKGHIANEDRDYKNEKSNCWQFEMPATRKQQQLGEKVEDKQSRQ